MTGGNDTFNYFAVLFSVVIGLAATEILQGIRRLLIARRRVGLYCAAPLWAGTLLVVLAQTWSEQDQTHRSSSNMDRRLDPVSLARKLRKQCDVVGALMQRSGYIVGTFSNRHPRLSLSEDTT